MKKLFSLLLIIACFMLTACGAPTPKEEAVKLNNSYVKQADEIYDSTHQELVAMSKKYGESSSEALYEFAKVVRTKNLPAINDLIAKFDKEQITDQSIKEMTRKRLLSTQKVITVFSTFDKEKDLNVQQRINFKADYITTMRQAKDELLIYNNEYSKLVNGKSSYALTLDNFKKIHKGDSYVTVANYFNMPGKLISTNDASIGILTIQQETFEWKNGESVVTIVFINNEAKQISQKNLQ